MYLKRKIHSKNFYLVYEAVSILMSSGSKGLLMLLDFEKAFDSLEWAHIYKILQAFNFGKGFIFWFNLINTGAISCAINNGHFTEFFKLE